MAHRLGIFDEATRYNREHPAKASRHGAWARDVSCRTRCRASASQFRPEVRAGVIRRRGLKPGPEAAFCGLFERALGTGQGVGLHPRSTKGVQAAGHIFRYTILEFTAIHNIAF